MKNLIVIHHQLFCFIEKIEDNIEEILERCYFGDHFSFPHNIDITRIDLSLYCLGEDESNESTVGYT